MPNFPRLNYSVENETAESAMKTFAVILQKAFEQYRKVWGKYLDLVKKYEGDSTTCEEIQKTWKETNVLESTQLLSENMDIFNKYASERKSWVKEEKTCDREQNNDIIEDMFEICNVDYYSDIYESTCHGRTPNKETKNIILPESPIFIRKDKKLISTISKNEISTSNDNNAHSYMMETDDTVNFNKHNDDSFIISEKPVNNISFNSLSPAVICNTPIDSNKCYKKNKQKLLKKPITCKYKQELEENTINHITQQAHKKNIPLQALENLISSSKVTQNHNGNKTRAKGFTEYNHSRVSPESKQTTVTFHTIKNKVDNAIVTSAGKNITITKCKKVLFKRPSYTESTLCQNEATSSKNAIDAMYVGNENNQNEEIYEDIIANSPNSIYMQSQNKNPLKLKRKFSDTGNTQAVELSTNINEFDSASISPHTKLIKTKHQTCLTKKENILSDSTICFNSGIIVESAKKDLKLFKDTQLKQKSIKNNDDFDETESIVHHESSLLDVFQSRNEDETYFEDHIEEDNNINGNRKLAICNENYISSPHKTLTNIRYESENPRENITNGVEYKTKKGWSCWQCTEYYKNKPNLSEECVQKWKNQCSRHRNIYYALQATPAGFWDPLLPHTASDSIQET